MAAPRTAKLSGTVTWSNGANFDGFIAIGVAVPTVSGVAYPTISMDATFPPLNLPLWTFVPVKDGAIDQNTKLFFNADLEPPGCRYAAYWYDVNYKRIFPAGSASLFDITVDPFSITVPTLAVPTTAVTAPVPET